VDPPSHQQGILFFFRLVKELTALIFTIFTNGERWMLYTHGLPFVWPGLAFVWLGLTLGHAVVFFEGGGG
jgi:hypothetical protein